MTRVFCRARGLLVTRCPRWTIVLTLLFAAANCFPANRAAAQPAPQATLAQAPNGFVVQVPNESTFSARTGLQLEIDTRWTNNYGYRPIQVRVRSEQPAAAEHRITIRLYATSSDKSAVSVKQSFDLPLGANEAATTISCPQYQVNHWYWWEVWVDGVRDPELSVERNGSWGFSASTISDPNLGAIKFLLPGKPEEIQQLYGIGSDLIETLALPPAEWPTRWLDYTAIDVIALTPAELRSLATAQPAAFAALRSWLHAGGQLWVHSVGEQWQAIGEVESLLELSAAGGQPTDHTDAALQARGWLPVDLRTATAAQSATIEHIPTGTSRVVRDPAIIARLKSHPDYLVHEAEPATDSTTHPPASPQPTDTMPWFADRRSGLGKVRAFRGEWDPIGFSVAWRMLAAGPPGQPAPVESPTPLTAAVETTKTWPARHGMTPDEANEDFPNWLVPGVGLAPVTEFRVLITLFVLVIGPLNYWLLKRANKLYLLLLTVPLMALALTSALFAYALVSDGLATVARVRSFTTLDGRTGDAACWARVSYYSGLAPGRGLVLPDDVAIFPIVAGWNESTSDPPAGETLAMEWASGEQRLTSGWLRSRVPAQYLTIRARKSPNRLQLRPADNGLVATNQLGTPISYLVASDAAGHAYSASTIADGATVTLKQAPHADVLPPLRRLLMENQPAIPAALVDNRSTVTRRSQQRQRRRIYQQQSGLDYSVERLSDNLQSEAFGTLFDAGDEALLRLPPNSYIAITTRGPEVDLGLPHVEEESSFHVVVGRW